MSTGSDSVKPGRRGKVVFLITSFLLLASAIFGSIFSNVDPASRDDDAEKLIGTMVESAKVDFITVSPMKIDEPEGDAIDGYPIVDSRVLEDSRLIGKLLSGLVGGNQRDAEACIFSPRHAVRLVDNPEHYILICFQCSEYEYSDGKNSSGGVLNRSWFDRKEERFERLIEELGMTPSPN